MKFRGVLSDSPAIRKFYNVLATMARLSKVCVLRLAQDKLFFILSESAGSVGVWCELARARFFSEYCLEGVAPETHPDIYLELEPDRLVKTLGALKSAHNSPAGLSLKIKLTRKREHPCLTFAIEANSGARLCTHDVQVALIPRRLWPDFAEPDVEAYDVSIYLPDLKQLKHLIERYKNLGHHVLIEADGRTGRLKLSVEADEMSVVTHFKDLERPAFDVTSNSSVVGVPSRNADPNSGFTGVRVELKRLSLLLSAELAGTSSGSALSGTAGSSGSVIDGIPGIKKAIIANLVAGKMVHLFLVQEDVCMQYFVPAVLE